MYKLIIVDDEQYTREGMKRILHWESYNIQLVNVSSSAVEGIEAARKYRPDIMITDIKMDNMDGLTMLEEIKKFLKCEFIVISGYSVFEYARRAIRAEVSSYLLKPVSRAELEKAVMKCIMKIEKNKTLTAAERLGNVEYVLDMLINEDISAEGLLPFNSYFVAVIKSENAFVVSYEDKIRIFEELSSAYNQCFVFFMKANEIAVVIDNLSEIERMLKIFPENCYIGLNAGNNDLNFKEIYKGAQIALKQAVREEKRYCEYGDNTIVYISEFYDDAYNRALMLLESGETEQAKREISKCYSKARADKVLYSDIMQWSEKMFYSVADLVKKNGDNSEQTEELIKTFRRIEDSQNGFDFSVSNLVLQLCDYCGADTELKSVSEKNKKINEIVEYINEHFSEDLSLEMLSSKFWIEKKYLSKLFKKYMNENYVEYLTRKRLEAAKSMLKESKLTISEIAERLSYGDTNYFAVLFKKNIGMTPKEYRLKYMK